MRGKKLKISQVLRGKILEYVESDNFEEKNITDHKVFTMNVFREYYLALAGLILVSEKKNGVFVATTTDKQITEERIIGLSKKVFSKNTH